MKKPKDLVEYKSWLIKTYCTDDINFITYKNYYESIVASAKKQFEMSNFWKQINEKFETFNANYYAKTKYPLFPKQELVVITKPFDSFLLKTYRKNVILNDNWPQCPQKYQDWINPGNWFEIINDLVRTTIVVKYLDGVEFILEKLNEESKKENLLFKFDYEAKDEGYYAVHTYITMNFEVPALTWDTVHINMIIEIQITTQIKDVIKKLTHSFYEDRRKDLVIENNKIWQWDYTDEKFTANYLGHILHYIEGMIMEIRDGKGGKK